MFWFVYNKTPQGVFELVFLDNGSKKRMCTQTAVLLVSVYVPTLHLVWCVGLVVSDWATEREELSSHQG